jgi:hypothetical protein
MKRDLVIRMNTKLEIRDSEIEGKGVFALMNIKKGQKVFTFADNNEDVFFAEKFFCLSEGSPFIPFLFIRRDLILEVCGGDENV